MAGSYIPPDKLVKSTSGPFAGEQPRNPDTGEYMPKPTTFPSPKPPSVSPTPVKYRAPITARPPAR